MSGNSFGGNPNYDYNGYYSQMSKSGLFADRRPVSQQQQEQNMAILLQVNKLDTNTGRPNGTLWSAKLDEIPSYQAGSNHTGMGVFVTVLFLIGEMVGGGLVAMPNAIWRSGWAGIVVIVLGGLASGYTGAQLGWCWTILQERWPQYLSHTRKPYPEIAYRSAGVVGRYLVTLCVFITLFAASTAFLLLASSNITDLVVTQKWPGSSICQPYWILIIAACLLPVTYLGSPKDFWQISFGATAATTVAVVVMIISISEDKIDHKYENVTYTQQDFQNFALGYGAIIFAYGGHSAFPTIQHDMAEPAKFPMAVLWCYIAVFFYYLPVSLLSYVVMGDNLQHYELITTAMHDGWMKASATLLITLHVIFSFIILVNPVSQELENFFKTPNRFCWQRVVIRTILMGFIIFLAQSVPSVGRILDLVGGTTIAAMTFVFPGWFYIALRWNTTTYASKADTPIKAWEWPVNIIIIAVGILGGAASVYAAVLGIINGGFQPPFYVDNKCG